MKAMLIRRYGDPDVFEAGELDGAILEGLATMIEKGQVRPAVEHVHTWDQLPDAHRRVETGRVTGKVAVVAPPAG